MGFFLAAGHHGYSVSAQSLCSSPHCYIGNKPKETDVSARLESKVGFCKCGFLGDPRRHIVFSNPELCGMRALAAVASPWHLPLGLGMLSKLVQ